MGAVANALKSSKAQARATSLVPLVEELKLAGALSLRALADGLNARGIPAPRGGVWQAVQIKRLLASSDILESELLRRVTLQKTLSSRASLY
jgi:hypothetical protein